MMISLDDAPLSADRVGGKASTLAGLRGAGFAVPPGVVLPVDLLAGWQDGRPAPDEVRAAVDTAVASLGPRPLAVRSSAVGEDAPDLSHAGQFATRLGAAGTDEVLAAVRAVLDSALAPRVRVQRGGVAGDPPMVRMAVLLQPLLAPASAGVAFTADPVTGDRGVVRVAATTGRGEGVTDGTSEPEEWAVGPNGARCEHRLAAGPVLTVQEASAVATAARAVADHLGRAQDVEWALVDGTVQILQARPITVLPTPPAEQLEGTGWQKDLAHYPEQLTPFAVSVVVPPMRAATRSFLADHGLLVEDLEIACIGGEVYTRAVPVVGGVEPPPFDPPAWLLGLAVRVVPALRERMHTARRVVDEGCLQVTVRRWHEEWRPELVARLEAEREVVVDEIDDDELLDHLGRLRELAEHGQRIHFQLFLPYLVAVHNLVQVCRELLEWDESATLRLLAGTSPASVAGPRELERIAAEVADAPRLVEALRARPADPVGALSDHDAAMAERLRTWLQRHGWRTSNYDPGSVAWAERPGLVTPILLGGGQGHVGGEHVAARAEREARAGVAALGAAERARLDAALAAAREVHPVREDNTVLTDSVPSGLLRRWLVEAGHRLAARGLLARAEDAAHATVDELVGALRGDVGDLRAEVARRRGEYAWVRSHPGPVYVGRQGSPPDVSLLPPAGRRLNGALLWAMEQEYPPPVEERTGPALLSGVGASPGRFAGPVCIIRRVEDFARLRPGQVLVCPVTTPAWSLLFGIAGAVVTDGGGALSHTSIVAREHGLPAVVGTGTATTTLQDGQVVEVDGTTGEVRAVG